MTNGRDFTMGRVGATIGRADKVDSHDREAVDDVPEELAKALDESLDDLKHNRTSDMEKFLERMQAKIDAAIAVDRGAKGARR